MNTWFAKEKLRFCDTECKRDEVLPVGHVICIGLWQSSWDRDTKLNIWKDRIQKQAPRFVAGNYRDWEKENNKLTFNAQVYGIKDDLLSSNSDENISGCFSSTKQLKFDTKLHTSRSMIVKNLRLVVYTF